MRKKMRVIGPLVAIVMLVLALPGTTVAHVPVACCIYGPVMVNGQHVPYGTEVTAWLDGPYVGTWNTTTDSASWYAIYIPPDDPSTPGNKEGAVVGDQVHFSVGGTPVPGTATWQTYGPAGILRVYHDLSTTHLTGDVDCDGRVDITDLTLVGLHFGETGAPGWIPEDVYEDGVIDILDMILIIQNWTG